MQFVVPGCKEAPPVRASGKTFHLTYAALAESELNHDYLLAAAREWASTRYGLREYVIGKEQHPQPADASRPWHFHLFLAFGKRLDIADRYHSVIFDLLGEGDRVLHPEIQSVLPTPGDRERVIAWAARSRPWRSVRDARRAATARADQPRTRPRPSCSVVMISERAGTRETDGARVSARAEHRWAHSLTPKYDRSKAVSFY